MGEIKKYDESLDIFNTKDRGGDPGKGLYEDTKQVKSLQPGYYWTEPHDCGAYYCAQNNRLATAAHRYFGKGNYSIKHAAGIIAILRKA